MGLIDFVKDAGRKIGMFGGRQAAEVEEAKAAAIVAAAQAKTATDEAAKLNVVVADVKAAIVSYVPIANLGVRFDGQKITLTGTATSQADREKAVLVAGNTQGVAQVDDQLTVVTPAPAATYHQVVAGDTLSEIAGRYYGVMRLFDAILEANRPMLTSADLIYPGQVLRVPPVRVPEHVVQKGETLGTIAKHWYGDAARFTDIATANRLTDPNRVDVGQRLTIPLIDAKVAPLA
jgi:nucleoid-associated protein YgaU